MAEPTIPDRLFGLPGAEVMQFSAGDCFELDIEPYANEHGDRRPWTIEEWTVMHPRGHMRTPDVIAEWVAEQAADELSEDGDHAWWAAAQDPEVVAAFSAALDLMASKISYRMADRLVAEHTVTWADDGTVLLDGEPMNVASQEVSHG